MLKRVKKSILFLIIVSIILVSVIYINAYIGNTKFSNSEFKVWAHAGYFENKDFGKNSIESFKEAFVREAKGTELDIFYDIKLKKFVVSHDYPYNLKNGNLLLLDSVFKHLNSNLSYWLDYKNLKQVSESVAVESISEMNTLLNKYDISKDQLLIESESLANIQLFTKNDFYTSWWINPRKKGIRGFVTGINYKLHYLLGDYSSMSMNHNFYSRVDSYLLNIPVNLFTVNDKDKVQDLINHNNVQIVLSDRDFFKMKRHN